MQCINCRFWQGRKGADFGDCYRVIAKVEPKLEGSVVVNDNDVVLRRFNVPFDAHDIKYWMWNSEFMELYRNMKVSQLGIRIEDTIEDDILYDQSNGERVGRLKLRFIQTHKDYECKEEE